VCGSGAIMSCLSFISCPDRAAGSLLRSYWRRCYHIVLCMCGPASLWTCCHSYALHPLCLSVLWQAACVCCMHSQKHHTSCITCTFRAMKHQYCWLCRVIATSPCLCRSGLHLAGSQATKLTRMGNCPAQQTAMGKHDRCSRKAFQQWASQQEAW